MKKYILILTFILLVPACSCGDVPITLNSLDEPVASEPEDTDSGVTLTVVNPRKPARLDAGPMRPHDSGHTLVTFDSSVPLDDAGSDFSLDAGNASMEDSGVEDSGLIVVTDHPGNSNPPGNAHGHTRVTICHKNKTKEVVLPALEKHLDHGDLEGSSPE